MSDYLADENTRKIIDVPEWYDPENEGHNIALSIGSINDCLRELYEANEEAKKIGKELKVEKAVERFCFPVGRVDFCELIT